MPVYEFDIGDGSTVEIDASNPEEAGKMLVNIPGVAGMRSSSPVERFTGGFQQSWGDTAYGAKQLAGFDLTPEQQNLIDSPMPSGLPGISGYLAGEVSQMAAPSLKLLKWANKLGKWGPAAADALLNAGQGYVKGVSDDESRVQNALGNTIGTALGRGGARLIGGVKPTEEALTMLDKGIRLTPGQAAGKGSVPGMIEESLGGFPVAGAVIRKMKRNSIKDWNLDRLAKVSPDGLPPSKSGREGIGEIAKKYSQKYDELLPDSLRFQADDQFTDIITSTINKYEKLLSPSDFKRLKGNLEDVWEKAVTGDLTGANLKSYQKRLNKMASSASMQDYNAGKAFEEASDALKDLTYRTLGPEESKALADLDWNYAGFLPVQEAMGMKGALTEGLFTPSQLIGTAKGRGTANARAASRGNNPFVEEAINAEQVLGNAIPPVGPGTAEKLGFVASMLEPNLLTAGLTIGAGYPMVRPYMTNAIGRAGIPEWLGKMQVSSQAGQALIGQ